MGNISCSVKHVLSEFRTFFMKKSETKLVETPFYNRYDCIGLNIKEMGGSIMLEDKKAWNTVYKEIANYIGEEKTIRLFNAYKGTNIAFPMRLISRESVKEIIASGHPERSVNQLAVETGYSERNIRRLIKELKLESIEVLDNEHVL